MSDDRFTITHSKNTINTRRNAVSANRVRKLIVSGMTLVLEMKKKQKSYFLLIQRNGRFVHYFWYSCNGMLICLNSSNKIITLSLDSLICDIRRRKIK